MVGEGMNGDVLRCYVSDETLRLLRQASVETGRSVEDLAESAIESAAIEYKVSRRHATPAGTP